ncbi:hypothetical protein D3C85_1467030 [compost metagenome]
MQICKLCRSKASSYDMLFKGLAEIPRPLFDFNVSELVPEHITASKPLFSRTTTIAAITAAVLISIALVSFRSYLPKMFTDLPLNLFYLILLPTISALIIQGFSLFKEHKKQMNTLNSTATFNRLTGLIH